MEIKKIVDTAISFLGLDGETADIDMLTRLSNLIINETAADYLNLVYTEEFVIKNGSVEFSGFKYKPVYIKSVLRSDGRPMAFKQNPEALSNLSGDKCKVVYSYTPVYAEYGHKAEGLPLFLSERHIAYGVAREYSVIFGHYEEAGVWEQKFNNALTIALKPRTEIGIPQRNWK